MVLMFPRSFPRADGPDRGNSLSGSQRDSTTGAAFFLGHGAWLGRVEIHGPLTPQQKRYSLDYIRNWGGTP